MKIKYRKDYRCNYMIMQCMDLNANSKYQIKMIDANRIDGILPCSVRYINGETFLYYEMSSKQSLMNVFTGKKIGLQELHLIFDKLEMVLEELRSYLLEDRYLVLLPEYIFMNLETEEIKFVFYPSTEDSRDWGLDKLLEFLLSVVDYEDQGAVDIVFKANEKAQKNQLIVSDIINWLQLDGKESDQNLQETEKQEPITRLSETPTKKQSYQYEASIEKEELHVAEELSRKQSSKKYFILSMILVAVGLLSVAVCIYVRYQFYLTAQYERITLLGIIAGGVFLLAGVLSMFFIYGKKKLLLWMKNRDTCQMDEDMDSNLFYKSEEAPVMNQKVEKEKTRQNSFMKEYGNTTFLPEEIISENKLYGIDRNNKYHIDLNHLPCTVGKMIGCADYLMNEDSISRMHTRFTEENGAIHMRDLNSTNGTFKNGLRLEPNESVIIEPGDEIRIGKFRFSFR